MLLFLPFLQWLFFVIFMTVLHEGCKLIKKNNPYYHWLTFMISAITFITLRSYCIKLEIRYQRLRVCKKWQIRSNIFHICDHICHIIYYASLYFHFKKLRNYGRKFWERGKGKNKKGLLIWALPLQTNISLLNPTKPKISIRNKTPTLLFLIFIKI